MFKARQVIWIGEPDEEQKKHYAKFGSWGQYAYWPCLMKYEDGSTVKFLMNETDHNVYLTELTILNQLSFLKVKSESELLKAIEEYGNKREEKSRHDVREDWAERGLE